MNNNFRFIKFCKFGKRNKIILINIPITNTIITGTNIDCILPFSTPHLYIHGISAHIRKEELVNAIKQSLKASPKLLTFPLINIVIKKLINIPTNNEIAAFRKVNRYLDKTISFLVIGSESKYLLESEFSSYEKVDILFIPKKIKNDMLPAAKTSISKDAIIIKKVNIIKLK